MNQLLQDAKRAIRSFWPNYSDERLAWLLAHARSSKLSYFSCCCLIGVATADHALQDEYDKHGDHIELARGLTFAHEAEDGFNLLGTSGLPFDSPDYNNDSVRRRRLIPMIKAEMKRREMLSTSSTAPLSTASESALTV